MLSPADVAEKLKVSYWTAVRLIRRGDIPAAKIGNQFRVSEEDLAAYIEASRVAVGGTR